MTARTVAILLFDEVEVLDFAGPFEVFSVANRFAAGPAFTVLTVAERARPVATWGGLSVNPHRSLADLPRPEIVLVPGGKGTRTEVHNPIIIDWIQQAGWDRRNWSCRFAPGPCCWRGRPPSTGSKRPRTSAIDLLRQTAPLTVVHEDRRVVDNGRVVLFAGIAAGIDMSLHVVGRLLGREVAEQTARQMEYPWAGAE